MVNSFDDKLITENSKPLEIGTKELVEIVLNNRILIAGITGISLIFSLLIAFLRQPTWQGQFQIVLSKNESSNISNIASKLVDNPQLANLVGISGSNKELSTEIEILKSPSVLMPVFTYFKKEKRKLGYKVDDLIYKDWVDETLNIALQRGTSVLNLAFKDKEKELIIPTLNKISKTYQEYSGKDRLKVIENVGNYLDDQINLFKIKSFQSIKKVEEYAALQDLPPANLPPAKIDRDNLNFSIIELEKIRIEETNKLRRTEELLSQIEKTYDDPEVLIFLSSSIEGILEQGILDEIRKINKELGLKNNIFTSQDKTIKDLIKRRKNLVELLRKQSYAALKASQVLSKANLKSAQRPEGVIFKYKNLLNEAARDSLTLNTLENQRRQVALEEAKIEDPWELITEPSLRDGPLPPSKKVIVFAGLLIGLIISIFISLRNELRKNLVYKEKDLQALFDTLQIDNISFENEQNILMSAKTLSKGTLSKISGKINIIPLGKVKRESINSFAKYLEVELVSKEVLITNDLLKIDKSDGQIIITGIGTTSRDEILDLKKRLLILEKPITGWILLKS